MPQQTQLTNAAGKPRADFAAAAGTQLSEANLISALEDLEAEIKGHNTVFVRKLQELLDAAEGLELTDVDQLQTFRVSLKRICERLGVSPLLPDGSRGSLQVVGTRSDRRGWTAIVGRHGRVASGASANTIPTLRLG